MSVKYKRVLIKVSGEALAGEDRFGVNGDQLEKVAKQIKEIRDIGVEVGVVVGGGNFFRGRTGGNIDKPTADYMGMLATVMNGLALQDALLSVGCEAKLMTSIEIRDMAEGYARRKALDYLAEGKVVVFGGGTGSPFFTTDTTAALRAAEIGADVLLLAKSVDAVYSADPDIDPDAERYTELSYMDIIDRDLRVMDLTAATLCKDTGTKIYVFALAEEGNLMKVINGENVGTLIQ
ncbi:MAG: UMP kinase [Mogibacterium sp.]|nr:UMP kinase [Mogibacterium sp.]